MRKVGVARACGRDEHSLVGPGERPPPLTSASQPALPTSQQPANHPPQLTQVLAARRLQQAGGGVCGWRRLQPLRLLMLNLLGTLLKLVWRGGGAEVGGTGSGRLRRRPRFCLCGLLGKQTPSCSTRLAKDLILPVKRSTVANPLDSNQQPSPAVKVEAEV